MPDSTAMPTPPRAGRSTLFMALRPTCIGMTVGLFLVAMIATPAVASDLPGNPAVGPAPVADGSNRDVRAAGATILLVLAARRASQVRTPDTVAERRQRR